MYCDQKLKAGCLQPGKVRQSGFCYPGLEQSWNLLKSYKGHGKVMFFFFFFCSFFVLFFFFFLLLFLLFVF